jgi:CRISPR system Cascade subunit CasB
MWRFYKTWWDKDERPWNLDAEHHALTLFAVHQQSQRYLVHEAGIPLGKAIRSLHVRFNGDAVDRRFFAALTTADVARLSYHLRGLLRQTHSLKVTTPLDYTRLCQDLAGWGDSSRRASIRRRWGRDYYLAAENRSSENNPNSIPEGDQ